MVNLSRNVLGFYTLLGAVCAFGAKYVRVTNSTLLASTEGPRSAQRIRNNSIIRGATQYI